VWIHQDTVIRLNVAGETLVTTEDHPFWNATDRAWERADAVDRGDRIGTADGRTAKYRRLFGRPRWTTAYNLTVQGVHTYHVGRRALLVHNSNTCGVGGQGAVTHLHHTVPREILKQLPEDVANNPLVRGRAGAPNRWPVPRGHHVDIHRGAGGGAYNQRWKDELGQLGRDPTVDDVLRIRDQLTQEFGLQGYRP
jgi:hypothetical protein